VLGAEIDGAYHVDVEQWTDDQLRQNEILLGGVPILRYPAIVVRDAPAVVAAQLAHALGVDGKGLAAV
jgi:hypothetical protein